ncbi:MAG: hypothetical protein K0S96_92 [Geminicoccaceae bacterium]|nr:hypothetical protein [Geminicoccaceae bacterium]
MPRDAMPILKNARRAIVDERKLTAYLLNPTHPRGRDKARISSPRSATTAPAARV